MTDIHTHILPGIDDGAKDAATSLRMTEMMVAQGVETVAATPHYYCLDRTPEQQQALNAAALEELRSAWTEKYGGLSGLPDIRTGAEICLAESLQETKELKRLKITGTQLMLFEMPFSGYRDWIPNLVRLLTERAGGIPVFAHVNRYTELYGMKNIERLGSMPGAVFQFNTECFSDRNSVRYIASLIKRGRTVFFASDCHGAHHRPPDMGEKLPELEKRLGKRFAEQYLRETERRQAELLRA